MFVAEGLQVTSQPLSESGPKLSLYVSLDKKKKNGSSKSSTKV